MAERKRADITGRYTGFKGYFENGVFIFASQEERDRWQIATYGQVRNGFREPGEPPDDRPMIARGACRCRGCREHGEVWRNESERLTYEHAVETHSRRPDEGSMTHIARIAGIVQGRLDAVAKTVPRPNLGPKAFQKRLNELEAQRGRSDD